MSIITSDNFAGDAYGWAGSAALHFCLGLATSTLLGDLGASLWAYPFAITAIYFFVVEVLDQKFTLKRDALLDTFYVSCGAVYYVAPNNWTDSAVALVAAAVGAWQVWVRL